MIRLMLFMHIPKLGQRESINGFPLFFLLVYMLKVFFGIIWMCKFLAEN